MVRRKLFAVVSLIGFGLALAGCDTCGNLAKFNYPSVPKSCRGDTPAK